MPEKNCKIIPDNIKCIAVTAPAGVPDNGKLAASLEFLRTASDVKIKDYIPEREPGTPDYLAGSAEARSKAFNCAVNDPEVDMILCARGGFGCVHILSALDYETLQKRNLPVMGYSDITALHCAMLKNSAGIPVAGSNLTGMENLAATPQYAASHLEALVENCSGSDNIVLKCISRRQRTVKACAYAANLTVLSSLCGSDYLPDFSNMILILEDVNEPLYKIDRMLNQLYLNKVFDNLAALAMGDFSGTESDPAFLFEQIAGRFDLPCFTGFPFGHNGTIRAVNAKRVLTVTPADL